MGVRFPSPAPALLLYNSRVPPRKIRSLWDRFWEKVQFPPEDVVLEQCWVWTAALSKKRGGKRPVIQEGIRGTRVLIAARVVCEWYHGPPPSPDHEAGHTCPEGENRLCVSPHHLRWMTREENERSKPPHRRRNRYTCITPDDSTAGSEALA